MPPQDGLKRIEEIKKRLFSKDERLIPKRKEWFFRKKKFSIGTTWAAEKAGATKDFISTIKSPKPATYKKFFLASIGFLVVAGVFATIMLFGGDNTVSTDRVKISILGNAFTAGGEDLPLTINISNENSVSIDSSELVIEYPRGSDATAVGDYERKRITLGTIAAGEEKNQNVTLVLYGEQGSTKDIKASIEYRVRGSNAIFTKDGTFTVNINTAPLSLTVDAPKDSVSNQDYTMAIHAIVGATHISDTAVVKVDYPPGFQFYEATPKPIMGNNVFAIEKKETGAENILQIRGTLIGVDGDKKAFRVYAGERDTYDQTKIAVIYNSYIHEITLSKPFIDAKLLVDGIESDTYTVSSKDKVDAEIDWSNNLPTRIDDLQISAKIYGSALNRTQISGSGFYDSNNDTITWDKNSTQTFATVEPGEHGKVTFRFGTISLLSGSQSVVSDPTVTVELSIKGRQPSEGVASKEVNGFKKVIFKINTDLQLTASAVYSSGPFSNTGPLPPKVGTETTYTVQWQVTNTGNKVAQAEVRATLPVNVRFVKADTAGGENITYSDITREIVWRAGNVARGAGFISAGRKASFQIAITPSLSQVGSVPLLLNDSSLSGQDLFTTQSLRATAQRLTTKLTTDPAFPSNGDRVVQ